MNTEITPQVEYVTIDDDNVEQRIDNFLLTKLKGVPKSMIYRIVRKGEVRVNKKRIQKSAFIVIGNINRLELVVQHIIVERKARGMPRHQHRLL